MAIELVNVPDIGGAEAEVIEVLVAVGDTVEIEQALLVLESDKASMEIPSTVAGTVVELLAKVGDELAEGAGVISVETSATSEEPGPEESQPEPAPEEVAGAPEAAPAVAAAESAAPVAAEVPVAVPDIGSDEAVELIEIIVAVGDRVAEGDSLVVLESDKASMEVPAPMAGEVSAISVKVGDEVRQGDQIALLVTEAGGEAVAATPEQAVKQEPAPAKAAAKPASVPESTTVAPSAPPAAAVNSASEVYAGPAVRKLAREFGVDLSKVKGSGPRGRIVKEDLHRHVQQALAKPAAGAAGAGLPEVPEVDFAAFGPVEAVERSRIDKVTAQNMQRSWLNVPHVTQFDDVDISDLELFRKSLKAEAEQRGTRLTPMPFLLKAVAVALRDNPKFNASLADGGESLVYKQYVHIGMAVDTPAGLVVPVIRDVDQKSIWQLAEEVLDMAARARDRKLKPADMQGGCFTISSLGNIGGRGFTPIVNTPEVGILGVSRASVQPVWNGSDFEPRTLLPIALSYDHRVINGGDGGRFMAQLGELLADIRRLAL